MTTTILFVLLLAAPGSAAPLAPGDHEISLEHEGRERFYLAHVPRSSSERGPLPVVLQFHGGGGAPAGHERWTGFDALADREGFIAVYPAGSGRLRSRFLTWNAGHCCAWAMDQDVDDVGFVSALLDDLATRVPVDARRVYATGLSNGAMMSYRLAAELSHRIAAIAPVGGARVADALDHARRVPVLHIHSKDDARALFEGGLGPANPWNGRRHEHPAVMDAVGQWVVHDGCAEEPRAVARQRGQPGADDESHTATLYVYEGCEDGSEVALWRLTGAGHVWPGPEQRYPKRMLGEATSVIDANEEIWKFFRRFELPRVPAEQAGP